MTKKIAVFFGAVFLAAFIAFCPSAKSAANAEGTGIDERTIAVRTDGGALYGWRCHSDGGELPSVSVEGEGNDAVMKLSRSSAEGELICYSFPFAVRAETTYLVSAFAKNESETGDGRLLFGLWDGEEFTSFASTAAGEKEAGFAFSYRTGKEETELSLAVCMEGTGTFFVNDFSVCVSGGAVPGKLSGIANSPENDNPSVFYPLSETDYAADSSDGDGQCLKLDDRDVYKLFFGNLKKDTKYRLSVDYKRVLPMEAADQICLRIDNEKLDGTRAYYTDNIYGGAPDVWLTYSCEFRSGDNFDSYWMSLWANGGYYIDNLSLTALDEEGLQYLPEGNFSGIGTEGFAQDGNAGFALQQDGDAVFVAGLNSPSGENERGKISPIADLRPGAEYTLSFEYCGGGTSAFVVDYGGRTLTSGGNSGAWREVECTFTAAEDESISIFGDNSGSSASYFRNIRLLDAQGNIVNPDASVGRKNIFPYGKFDDSETAAWRSDNWTLSGGALLTDSGISFFSYEGKGGKAESAFIPVTGHVVSVRMSSEGTIRIWLETEGGTLLSAKDGEFLLPDGTKRMRIVLSSSDGCVSEIVVCSHDHRGTMNGQSYICSVCGRTVDAGNVGGTDEGGCGSAVAFPAVFAAGIIGAVPYLAGRKKNEK